MFILGLLLLVFNAPVAALIAPCRGCPQSISKSHHSPSKSSHSNVSPLSSSNSPFSNSHFSKSKIIASKKFLSAMIFVGVTSLPIQNAKAGFDLFVSDEQKLLNEVSSYQRPVNELLDQLKPNIVPNAIGVFSETQVLKGGKQDSDVVATYMEVYFKPLQRKMEFLASRLKLSDSTLLQRVEILPALMKGHIAELSQAVIDMKASSQQREVEEIQETLAEFLKLASVEGNYIVQPYVATRPLTDAELFGPLGCEFWGKKRLVGSNACIEK